MGVAAAKARDVLCNNNFVITANTPWVKNRACHDATKLSFTYSPNTN